MSKKKKEEKKKTVNYFSSAIDSLLHDLCCYLTSVSYTILVSGWYFIINAYLDLAIHFIDFFAHCCYLNSISFSRIHLFYFWNICSSNSFRLELWIVKYPGPKKIWKCLYFALEILMVVFNMFSLRILKEVDFWIHCYWWESKSI